MATNYSIGATFERKVVHQLLDQGAISVVRAAGSKSYGKGKIDLIALFKDKVWLIQCKRHGLISWKEKEEGLEIGEILSPYAYSILAYYKGGMHFTEFKDFFVKKDVKA